MRFRRHLPALPDFPLPSLPKLGGRAVRILIAAVLGAILAGYLTAYLIIFPAPILPGHQAVPRVLGLTLSEAQEQLTRAEMEAADGGSDAHPTATEGTVIWQDPPPGVVAPEQTKVALVTSAGPPKIALPDVAGYDGTLARQILAVAGLTVARVESVAAPVPRGVTMLTRPTPGTNLAPGTSVTLVVSRGAPTITVPGLLGLSQADARTRLELEGLVLGTVTRRRTNEASPGVVIEQRPAAGTLAAPGTVVDIVVARSL
jgi:eukaryotic-like serine/threonine-protein kinase